MVKRTQIYLDDQLWAELHALAARTGATVSELLRRAAREKYLAAAPDRVQAFRNSVGLWKNRADIASGASHVRSLRRGERVKEE
jgi:predicted DNA-binding protein